MFLFFIHLNGSEPPPVPLSMGRAPRSCWRPSSTFLPLSKKQIERINNWADIEIAINNNADREKIADNSIDETLNDASATLYQELDSLNPHDDDDSIKPMLLWRSKRIACHFCSNQSSCIGIHKESCCCLFCICTWGKPKQNTTNIYAQSESETESLISIAQPNRRISFADPNNMVDY